MFSEYARALVFDAGEWISSDVDSRLRCFQGNVIDLFFLLFIRRIHFFRFSLLFEWSGLVGMVFLFLVFLIHSL